MHQPQKKRTHLGFFKALIIVGLEFNEGSKNILVLIGIFVSQLYLLSVLINTRLLKILQVSIGILPPEFL